MANDKRKGRRWFGSEAVRLPPEAPAGPEKPLPLITTPVWAAPLTDLPELDEPVVSRGTLAARVADAAAAQLLLFDDLPEDERPRPDDRVLLAGLIWGDETLIELEQVSRGGDLRAGKFFDLPAVKLPANFRIVQHQGDGHLVTVPAELKTEVHRSGMVRSFRELGGRRIDAPFPGFAHELLDDDRVVVQVAPQLTLIARYVRAARHPDKPLLETVDVRFASTVLAALFFFALFWLMVRIAPQPDPAGSEDLAGHKERITQYQVKPSPEKLPEQPRFKDVSGVKEGAKAHGDEGKLGKQEIKKKEADPSRKGATQLDHNKREADRRKVMKLGLVAALSKVGAGGGSAASNVLGPGGLGTGINNALGGVKGSAGVGDAYGVGGMGSRGTGRGGGGTALGIGGLGTKGSGGGRGGYGEVDLGGRGKEETQFVPGRTLVVGGLSRDVINRIIQRHYNEVKYCYEKELSKKPDLYGKVTVLFVIDGTGKVGDALVQQSTLSSEPVEACMMNHVRRWTFPAPQGGGTVQVTYPYVFKSSAQ